MPRGRRATLMLLRPHRRTRRRSTAAESIDARRRQVRDDLACCPSAPFRPQQTHMPRLSCCLCLDGVDAAAAPRCSSANAECSGADASRRTQPSRQHTTAQMQQRGRGSRLTAPFGLRRSLRVRSCLLGARRSGSRVAPRGRARRPGRPHRVLAATAPEESLRRLRWRAKKGCCGRLLLRRPPHT